MSEKKTNCRYNSAGMRVYKSVAIKMISSHLKVQSSFRDV